MDEKHARTLAVIRQLAMGLTLALPDGTKIGMAEDMSIGFVLPLRGEESISSLSELNTRQLHALLEKHDIGHPIL